MAGDENPLDPAALCAFLTGDLPVLKAAGSTAGAGAQFAGDFGVWVDAHPTQQPRSAADLDTATLTACPKVRTAVVAVLGSTSFEGALGG